jgi:benzoyl-CoA reductase/2-hydroxyglutaryl-CoA dehydratase subunit BcrC/BadD/HgdB
MGGRSGDLLVSGAFDPGVGEGDPFAPFARAYADPEADGRARHAAGGKVVGYMSAAAPVELVEAAGMFALRLDGRGRLETPQADAIVEERFDPSVRAVYDRIAGGGADFLDAVILPRATDSVQRLYYYLCEVQRASDGRPSPLLFDLLHTPGASSAAYTRARLGELQSRLEEISERRISDDDLRAAITASRRRRDALVGLLARRRSKPATISGCEALQLVHAARVMAPERFVAAALRFEATPLRGTERRGPRIVLAGDGPDTLDLHALIEETGAVVVGDYHETGELSVGGGIDPGSNDPMAALGSYYHARAFSPRRFPSRPDDLVAFADAASADGVVFLYFAEEEVLTWDYPAQRRLLDEAGIPSLCLSDQPYRIDRATIAPIIAQFVGVLSSKARAAG